MHEAAGGASGQGLGVGRRRARRNAAYRRPSRLAGPRVSSRTRVCSGVLGAVAVFLTALCAVAAADVEVRQGEPDRRARAFDPRTPEFRREARESEARAERKAARRSTAAAREERRRSRSAFRGLGPVEAREVAARMFPEMLGSRKFGAPRLDRGGRIDRYLGDHWARVDHGAGEQDTVIRSFTPLRAESETGEQLPVDFDLVDRGSFFEPENSPSPVRISERAAGGAQLEASGVGVRPTTDPSAGSDASVLAGKAFYASIAQDTDFVVEPTPMGLETYWVLRSAAAPENLSLELDLPPGATARERPAGSGGALSAPPLPQRMIEIVRDGEVIASIHPPVAQDAGGHPVEVSMALDGTRVLVHVAHRGRDLEAPILVDPVVEDYLSWKDVPGYTDPNATFNNWFNDHGGCGAAACGGVNGYAGNSYLGKGLYAWGTAGHYFTQGRYSQWIWRAPGDAYIYRADFGWIDHEPANSNFFEGIFSYSGFYWESLRQYANRFAYDFHTQCQIPCWWGPPEGQAGTPGNAMVFGIQMRSNATVYGQPMAFMGGAQIGLHEYVAPRLSGAPTHTGLSSGWVRSANIRSEIAATDSGLGLKSLNLTSPTGWSKTGHNDGCNGLRAHTYDRPCHPFFYVDFNYHTDTMPEGNVTVHATAKDVVDNPANVASWQVKIDRTAPNTSIAADFADGELLRDRDYTITGTSTDSYSGSQRLAIKLDGVEKKVRTDCPANTSPCQLTLALDGGDPALAAGEHTLQVTTVDRVGNQGASATRRFRIERTDPTLQVQGTLKPSDGGWVRGGDHSLLLDAADAGTGVTQAELHIDDQVVETFVQDCASGACELTHDFTVNTDTLAEGEHSARALVRDGAGNRAWEDWTFRVERTAPSLTLSGTLKAMAGQTLSDGTTYTLIAGSTDMVGTSQSGVESIAVAIDDDPADIESQECPFGGCAMTRTFEYRPDDYESGPRTITVTATDFAGNQTSDSFVVTNPEPPALRCPDPPAPTPAINPVPTTPEMALTQVQSSTGFPEAVAPAQATDLDGMVIQPGLDASDSVRFRATGTVAQGDIDREASDGATATLETLRGPVCLTPTEVSIGASQPSAPVNGVAAMYANSRPATDTVVRPSPAGVQMFSQLRAGLAPKRLAWHVALQPGQELRQLVDGEVAVVIPAPEGAAPPVSGVVLPPKPTVAQRQAALGDTALALDIARDQFRRAQARTADEIVALIPDPWARDAQGRAVPTSVTASGSTVELRVEHDLLANEFPVIAALHMLGGDSVDEIEAAKSSEETAEYTEEEADSFDPAAGAPAGAGSQSTTAAPAAVAATASPDDPDYDADPVSGSADDSDDLQGFTPPDDDEEPPPGASTAIADAELARNVGNFGFGLTESDPANLDDPKRSEAGLQFYRPFVAWNIVALKASTKRSDVRRVRRWEDYYNRAKALGLKLDVVLTRTADVKKGGVAPPIGEYKAALSLFLDTYPGVVKNLMPWNEPNFKKDPLHRRPVTAAQYWIAAQNICHPKGTTAKPNPPARCGHVVAGDYVGLLAKHDPKVVIKGERRRFTTAYKNRLDSRGQRPKVWAFHNYGDWKAWGLRAKNREQAPITDRHYRLFRQRGENGREDYRFRQGSERRLPKIWLTEAGVGYHYSCKDGLTEGFQRRYCGRVIREDQEDRFFLMGMANQRSSLAFLLSKLAKDFPAIKRIYYLRLRAGTGRVYPEENGLPATRNGECEIKRPPPESPRPWCPKNDYGLVGADDDGTYEFDHFLPRWAGRSSPNQRRLAFCLFRDRDTRQGRFNIKNPERLKSCGAPASQ